MRCFHGLVLAVALLGGCTCKKTEPEVVAPPAAKPQPLSPPATVDVVPDASVENTVAVAPSPADEAPKPDDDADADAGEAPVDPVEAYRADCAHEFKTTVDSMGEPTTGAECTNREFEQNCAPDSCFDDQEACKDKCGVTCTDCQSKCVEGCTSCKQDCSVDGGAPSDDCITQCAAARSDCRDTCMEQRGRCMGADCSREYDTCSASAAQRMKEQCPDCDKLTACMQKTNGTPDKCLKKFPRNAAECAELCFAQ